ncbi:1979_t:CDS:1, partial [Cetraspora pellucida]
MNTQSFPFYSSNRWLETDIADVTNPLYSLAKNSRLLKFIITQHDRELRVDLIPCKEFYSLFACLQNIIKDKSVDYHFKHSSSNSSNSVLPKNTCINYHKGYRLMEGLVENMIQILYHTPRGSPTTPPDKCTRDIYYLYRDWPGLDEINKNDPILSYDPLDPMLVQAVYKELTDVVDNLVQSVNGNNEETKYLETKLVYYLERYDKILNPDDCKTVIKRKYDDGNKDENVSGSN